MPRFLIERNFAQQVEVTKDGADNIKRINDAKAAVQRAAMAEPVRHPKRKGRQRMFDLQQPRHTSILPPLAVGNFHERMSGCRATPAYFDKITLAARLIRDQMQAAGDAGKSGSRAGT